MLTIWSPIHMNDFRAVALPEQGRIRPGETADELARRLILTNYPLRDVESCRAAVEAFGDEWLPAVSRQEAAIAAVFGGAS